MSNLRAPPVRVITTIAAAIKIGIAAAATAYALARGEPAVTPRSLLFLAHVLAFGIAGGWLLAGGRRDPRAGFLGTTYLLVGSVFADSVVGVLYPSLAAQPVALRAAMGVQVDAFTPFFLWQFVREFPRVIDVGKIDRRIGVAVRVSLWVGAALFVANALLATGLAKYGFFGGWLQLASRRAPGGAYWILQFALTIVAFPVLAIKTWRAVADERGRGLLLVGGILAGTAPTVLWVFAQAVMPAVGRVLPVAVVGWVLYPTLLSTPFTTAYAVLVRRALDVKLVIRLALQYVLARYTLLASAVIPVAILGISVYRRRNESVATLVSSPSAIYLVLLATGGSIALSRHRQLLTLIDHRYFREQYDARRILGRLVERCRTVTDARDLATILEAEIDRALHVDTIHVLLLDASYARFIAPTGGVRSLDAVSPLIERLSGGHDVLPVDFERDAALQGDIPDESVHWIVDGAFRLLVPLRNNKRDVIGIIALGEKRSELAFSREDHALLASVGQAAEMMIAYQGSDTRETNSLASVADERASECTECGTVQPANVSACSRCGAMTTASALAHVVGGKFLVDERIGAGGMGVVYRAMDVNLGRTVAIKTLPYLTPGEAMRLRREARAVASVSHPNLALIFGAEVWRGQPMLIFEYLSGGTLADRLVHGPLSIVEVIELGIAMASVLDAIHSAGVLHRDIKPSNIGFASNGTPKLLDFGLARIMTAVTSDRPRSSMLGDGFARNQLSSVSLGPNSATDSALQGTPRYMAPEAFLGLRPDPSFDLWSLCVVLYEASAGPSAVQSPFHGSVLLRFPPQSGDPLPPTLADFFRRALSERREDRPRNAKELADSLRGLSQHFLEPV